jgi:hypothetical protein
MLVGADKFNHAIQVFVACAEHDLPAVTTATTSSPPNVLSHIRIIIQQVETRKAKTNRQTHQIRHLSIKHVRSSKRAKNKRGVMAHAPEEGKSRNGQDPGM